MDILLQPARATDLDFIMDLENRTDFAPFILRWSRNRHLNNIEDPDKRYLIIRHQGQNLGFVILEGLASPHASICLTRIVATAPGRGLGGPVLELVKKLVFEDLGAARLWLDVVPENLRAQKAYLKAGFVVEGTLRQAMIINGQRVSLIIMSILAEEYRSSQRLPPRQAD